MTKDTQYMLTQMDVSGVQDAPQITVQQKNQVETNELLQELIIAQHRQNELLEEIVEQMTLPQRQRIQELAAWKQNNPHLAKICKFASDKLGALQTDLLNAVAEEIENNFETLQDSDYYFNDFIDRFGPRFAHFHGILQTLSQLGNAPDTINTKKRS